MYFHATFPHSFWKFHSSTSPLFPPPATYSRLASIFNRILLAGIRETYTSSFCDVECELDTGTPCLRVVFRRDAEA